MNGDHSTGTVCVFENDVMKKLTVVMVAGGSFFLFVLLVILVLLVLLVLEVLVFALETLVK